jgi:hypothetical protein
MGIWNNRNDSELRDVYMRFAEDMAGQHLNAPPVSHYSGAFGFQSMISTTEPMVAIPDETTLGPIRAHEAFHGFQAMAFQSCRELFRSMQMISRRQLLTLGQMVVEGVKIRPGQTIFDAGARCESSIFLGAFKKMDSSISTLEKSLEAVAGVSMLDLIEGSAAAVEILNRHGNYHTLKHIALSSQMDEMTGVYGSAWKFYRDRGGESLAVFSHLCCSSLRYGSVSPPNFDSAPSPQEVYEYLTRFSRFFDSYVTDIEFEEPEFSNEFPLGDFFDADFNPRKADIPKENWADYQPSTSDNHHFPDSMFEDNVESALESYKENRTQDQLRLQDNLFGVSMSVVRAVNAAYIRVGPEISEEQVSSDGRMIYDRVASEVNRILPGLQIEEVQLRAIAQPDFQSKLAKVFESEVGKIRFHPWHNSSVSVSHKEIVFMYELAQKIERISFAEHFDALSQGEVQIFSMPYCCDQHRDEFRTLHQIVSCENLDSIASAFKGVFGVPFANIWSL